MAMLEVIAPCRNWTFAANTGTDWVVGIPFTTVVVVVLPMAIACVINIIRAKRPIRINSNI